MRHGFLPQNLLYLTSVGSQTTTFEEEPKSPTSNISPNIVDFVCCYSSMILNLTRFN
jgi:hypothetical protein